MNWICQWLFVGTLACLPAFAEDYEIRIHRPLHEGDKYKLSASGRNIDDSTMLKAGKVEKTAKSDFSAQMDAIVTVLATDNGKAIKQSLAVNQLIRIENGETNTLIKGGATVTAAFEGGSEVFTVDGRPASREEQETLELVSDIERPGSNDDQIFGTSERKKIGDSWPANDKLLIELINANGEKVSRVSGKTTLKDVVKEPGGPVLILAVDVTGTPTIPLPPGGVIEQATMKTTLSGRYPVDLTRGRPEDSMETTFSIRARGKPEADGPEMELNLGGKKSGVFKRTLIR